MSPLEVLVIGAGKSTYFLLEYLYEYVESVNGEIYLADANSELLQKKSKGKNIKTVQLDITDQQKCFEVVRGKKLVVSMLPASMHIRVAEICLQLGVNLITASYISPEIQKMHNLVEEKGLIFLNELGVDPGLDHLSAMQALDRLRNQGNEITAFESFTGGLMAPESENPPWNYKFTWNPRNVVLAGQGGAVKFLHEGRYKYIPYQKLFRRTEIINIEGFGKFEGYANRDSLKYQQTYKLEKIKTLYRGTLRKPGFCKAWNLFVQLGLTDDSYKITNSDKLTNRDFINTFLPYHPSDSVEIKLKQYLSLQQDDIHLWEKLEYLELFKEERINLPNASPAEILESILTKKWTMKNTDKDMVAMWHKIGYRSSIGKSFEEYLSMVVIGENQQKTAMAKTVGLPLAIGAKLILENKISQKGVLLPTYPEIYEPILAELKDFGIVFEEKTIE